MSSFRLIPTFRLARRLAKEVSPRVCYDHWGMRPWMHSGWGHPAMLPSFGPHNLSRILEKHSQMFENLNRIADLSAESFWCEDEPSPAKSDATTNHGEKQAKNCTESPGFGQEISPEDGKGNEIFKVSLKVGEVFKPEEIKVKIIGRCLQIEGKHEERGDNSHYVNRQFAHSYNLPMDVDDTNFVSTLTAEGILNIEAPRLQQAEVQNERHIPIQQEPRIVKDEPKTAASDAPSSGNDQFTEKVDPKVKGESTAQGDHTNVENKD
ncbi:uncharacterized protein [Apostichopus japonicus]|uniref:uncharacterized protein n=1 Tax=Stichopus japonicus TaxID=307972 RepID=UPI003AB91336